MDADGAGEASPIRYSDHSTLVAGFGASSAKVQTALPSDRLRPIELETGAAPTASASWEYRQIESLAPYNEFMVLASVMYQLHR
jgi:hypothetical protein